MSAADQAQDALFALIKDDPGFEAVLVKPGIPFELQKANERVYVSEDIPGYRRSRGGDYIDETFDLVVVLEVWRSGEQPGPAKARTWVLIDALDELLERHDFYGYGSEDGELTAALSVHAYDNGRLVRAVVTIAATALS